MAADIVVGEASFDEWMLARKLAELRDELADAGSLSSWPGTQGVASEQVIDLACRLLDLLTYL